MFFFCSASQPPYWKTIHRERTIETGTCCCCHFLFPSLLSSWIMYVCLLRLLLLLAIDPSRPGPIVLHLYVVVRYRISSSRLCATNSRFIHRKYQQPILLESGATTTVGSVRWNPIVRGGGFPVTYPVFTCAVASSCQCPHLYLSVSIAWCLVGYYILFAQSNCCSLGRPAVVPSRTSS